jgi:formylglycine-generating enzyme required for sulfatase activity
MKANNLFAATLFVFFACLACPANAVTTTGGFTGFTMDFVDITGGTTDYTTGYGAVANDYRMGVHEVSGAMIDAYNANSGGPAITRYAQFSASQPATEVSWNEAARFVNWLNVSTGHSPAYKFTGILGNDNIELWTPGDTGYDPSNLFRNTLANYFLPSEDEWYRAAYYDPSAGAYWDYATGSDSAPTAVSGGTATGTAVYKWPAGPADITNAGGLSPFGTMAQNGNVWEWAESGFVAPNDSAGEDRAFRGGSWRNPSGNLVSSFRSYLEPMVGSRDFGFRVAAVPEPATATLAALGLLGLVFRRRRG